MSTHAPRHLVTRRRRLLVALTAVGAVLVLAGGAVVVTTRDGGGCPAAERGLRIAVTPEMAAVVTQAADAVAQQDQGADARCRRPIVEPREPAAVARLVGSHAEGGPDLWVPDARLWVEQAGFPAEADAAPSLARSPVVFAVSEPVYRTLGSGRRRVDVARLLDADGEPPLHLTLGDPRRSAAAVGAVLAVQDVSGGSPATLAAVVRAAQHDTFEADPLSASDERQVVPVSEQRLFSFNTALSTSSNTALSTSSRPSTTGDATTGSAHRRVAVYPRSPLMLDYPFVVVTKDHRLRAAAAGVFHALQSDLLRRDLAAAGFRAPTGIAGPDLTAAFGVDGSVAASGTAPRTQAVADAVVAFERLAMPMRMLAVIDVSREMGQHVSGRAPSGGSNSVGPVRRIDWARDAVRQGVSLFPDEAEAGLWTFASGLTATSSHRQLIPVQPLGATPDGGTGRRRFAGAAEGIDVTHGGNALYDTTLAAVRRMRADWDPQRVNSVVIITAGSGEGTGGTTLRQLVETLRSENQDRPVPVIMIGLGPSAEEAPLLAISQASGGASYHARDGADLQALLLDALGRRACRPRC